MVNRILSIIGWLGTAMVFVAVAIRFGLPAKDQYAFYLAWGGLVCVLAYYGLLKVPARYLFAVTTVLIAFLAAGMASQAISFLERANALTALDNVVWDTSSLLSETSIPGRALHTLIGYTDQPTQMQLLVYLATLAAMFVLMKLFGGVEAVPAPARQAR